jgi:NAD(P)-dependent dehydrogenase (short-subunit alcohol dehydrogenase family)
MSMAAHVQTPLAIDAGNTVERHTFDEMEKPIDTLLTSLPKDFRAVVIGASGGIGSAICDMLERQPTIGELVRLSRSQTGLDLADEVSIAVTATSLGDKPIHLLICATGVLTVDGRPPEKAMRQIDPDVMLRQFQINAVGPALIAKHFLPRLDRRSRSVAAFLSARVGSIGDNRLGGWISYRSAKAALNQIVHTAAIEVARTHPATVVIAIHPGTVRTGLSDPYAQGHPTVSAEQAAQRILETLNGVGPGQTGSFLAYDGSEIVW